MDGCRAICKAMTTNVSVRALNLNNNPVSNEGGMAVAEMLYVRCPSTHTAAAATATARWHRVQTPVARGCAAAVACGS